MIPPGYLDMVMIEKHARLIATGSQTVQTEACFHLVPCVTLRTETEWVELAELVWNRLIAPARADAVGSGALACPGERASEGPHPELHGNGQAAQAIVRARAEQRAEPCSARSKGSLTAALPALSRHQGADLSTRAIAGGVQA